MRIDRLPGNTHDYCCNIYLVRGDYNGLDDVNALVDVGIDGTVVQQVEASAGGIGKKHVERVVVTHGHYDHAGGLPAVVRRFDPEVWSWGALAVPSQKLHDGQRLRLGDRTFIAIHTPGHSDDSICLHCHEEGILFSGDTPVDIKMPGGDYSEELLRSLERIAGLHIRAIYPGHHDPIVDDAPRTLHRTLDNVRRSRIVPTEPPRR